MVSQWEPEAINLGFSFSAIVAVLRRAENSSGLGSISCTAVQFTVIRIWHLSIRGMFLLIILHLTGSH